MDATNKLDVKSLLNVVLQKQAAERLKKEEDEFYGSDAEELSSDVIRSTREATAAEEAFDSDEDDTVNSSVARVYLKLPPPRIPIIPLSKKEKRKGALSDASVLHTEDDITRIDTKQDFQRLKLRVNEHIFKMEKLLFSTFQDADEDIVYCSMNENKVRSNEQGDDDTAEQPTAIQLLKALEKASNIVQEVERSRAESEAKKRVAAKNW